MKETKREILCENRNQLTEVKSPLVNQTKAPNSMPLMPIFPNSPNINSLHPYMAKNKHI